MNEILERGFLQVKRVDPDTGRQWLRLQRAIERSESEAVPARSRFIPRLAFVVAAVALALLGVYFYYSSMDAPVTYATERGEQRQVVLDDGSHVTLSYATELVVPKLREGKPRQVSLAGEAYFRVRHSADPFIISTHLAVVEVVGTEFNLQARGGALEVAVIDGKVRVSATRGGKDSALTLTRRQMAFVARNDFPRRIGDLPSPEYPGWMHGRLFLNRTSFSDACREIEMRFGVSVSIKDRRLRTELLTGILDARNAETAIAALCELTAKRFRREGEEFHID